MKKINKTIILAEKYYKWQKNNNQSRDYSKNRLEHYTDVVYNLLYCQDGCCAYTEELLVEKKVIGKIPSQFNDGKFKGSTRDIMGDIEHFCCMNKKTHGWNWDNLFIVSIPVNRGIKMINEKFLLKQKGKGINPILKPDHHNYDPFKYLEYNSQLHQFFPKDDPENDPIIEDIEDMLFVLGMNHPFVVGKRRRYLSEKFHRKAEISEIEEYFTAFKMATM
ncbi:hypothetical protein ACFLSY_01920 [Bacteroidota bacterium]